MQSGKSAKKPKAPSVEPLTPITREYDVNSPNFMMIPLGGMEEIGKNMTVLECDEDIIIIDCGMKFPDNEQYGIDLVIPDYSYLEKKADRIRGVFLTHGHEDHIGAIPYFVRKFPNVPIYGTKLTIGILQNKLVEHELDKTAKLNISSYHSTVKVPGFKVEFVVVNHSIPDSTALYITCKGGTIFHTGDFKIDLTPVDNQRIDLARMATIGQKGVDLLISDSTNANKAGYTASESSIGEKFMQLFSGVKKRIIVASFATNVHRIQQVFDAAKYYDRKVAVSGRSMINVINVAGELGYLKFDPGIIIDLKDAEKFPGEQVVILTTGSQGEPLSALARMANGEHRQLKVTKDDLVIISASPIPGNEKTIAFVISDLMKLGAQVVYQGAADVHVSGHASAGDLSLILSIIKPKNFVPCHGEYRMLRAHYELAQKIGVPAEHAFTMQNGQVLDVTSEAAKIIGNVPAGAVLIDGIGVGDVGNIVLKDRKRLSEDGLFIVVATLGSRSVVSGPDIVSRGFVYMRESEEMLLGAKDICVHILNRHTAHAFDYSQIKTELKSELEKYLYEKTKRKPMILPILMYVKD